MASAQARETPGDPRAERGHAAFLVRVSFQERRGELDENLQKCSQILIGRRMPDSFPVFMRLPPVSMIEEIEAEEVVLVRIPPRQG